MEEEAEMLAKVDFTNFCKPSKRRGKNKKEETFSPLSWYTSGINDELYKTVADEFGKVNVNAYDSD